MAFMIVGKKGPMYECDLGSHHRDEAPRSAQFILHAALDMVDLKQWTTALTYLRNVDKFNEHVISAFVTPGNVRYLVMHDGRHEDGMRHFFNDVHSLYLRWMLNPFYKPYSRIESKEFDASVKALARRYLGAA